MPQRKGRRAPAQRGAGFWGDVWNGIKKVGGVIKDSKLISKSLAGNPDPRAQTAASIAGSLGFGKKKRSARGRGLVSMPAMKKKPMLGMGAKSKMTVL